MTETYSTPQMPVQMLGRPILNKQISYSFYRPAALALANTLADIPFSASRILVYNIIVYLCVISYRVVISFSLNLIVRF